MNDDSTTARTLADHHYQALKASAISHDTIASRGYFTETEPERLLELGFNANQSRLVPALVLPIRDYTGEVVTYRIRPDEPRNFENGKKAKYEPPAGSRNVLDVPAPVLNRLHDISHPLWICEGEKKCDALVSQGEVALGLLGVWAWKRNGLPLPDFDHIPLIGRDVRVAFDSDTATNTHIRHALSSLASYIAARGATVKAGWMPPGENGEKQGVDNLLAKGAAIEDLEHYLRPYTASQSMYVEGWPTLAEQAYYGLAGKIVKQILPHTEADPAALLLTLLVYIGCIVGRGAHFTVEGDTHYLKEFAVLVGKTAKGRKGVSEGRIKELFLEILPSFIADNTATGLSSGEGLIEHVRDQRTKVNRQTGDVEVIDEGVVDKRVLITEPEFASTLTVMSREGNTLSMVVRNAWDDRLLKTMTRGSPLKSTGSHVSILGHVTQRELKKHLTEERLGAGIANRFLFALVHRSKSLPHDGKRRPVMPNQKTELVEAIRFGQEFREMPLAFEEDSENGMSAMELWEEVYAGLSEGEEGLYGAVTSRAEVHVRKIATLYAVLDKSPTVGVPHLLAGLAVWQYAQDSARYLFGELRGDHVADEIVAFLEVCEPDGATKSEINAHFGGHVSSKTLNAAIADLVGANLIKEETEKHDGPGRPTKRYHHA